MSELVVSVMEDTFLNRLADPTYGVPVVKSKFSSYPAVITSAKGFAPDPDMRVRPQAQGAHPQICGDAQRREAHVRRCDRHPRQLCGLPKREDHHPSGRSVLYDPAGEKRTAARRRGHLHPREKGLCPEYGKLSRRQEKHGDRFLETSADGRRKPAVLAGCSPGRRKQDGSFSGIAHALGTARGPGADHQIFRQRLWGGYASGPGTQRITNPIYGEPNPFANQTYSLPDIYAEGATYAIPRWVSPDVVEIAEMGSPGMDSFTISYEDAQKARPEGRGRGCRRQIQTEGRERRSGREDGEARPPRRPRARSSWRKCWGPSIRRCMTSPPVQPRPAEGDDAVQGYPRRTRSARRFQGGQSHALCQDGCA